MHVIILTSPGASAAGDGQAGFPYISAGRPLSRPAAEPFPTAGTAGRRRSVVFSLSLRGAATFRQELKNNKFTVSFCF